MSSSPGSLLSPGRREELLLRQVEYFRQKALFFKNKCEELEKAGGAEPVLTIPQEIEDKMVALVADNQELRSQLLLYQTAQSQTFAPSPQVTIPPPTLQEDNDSEIKLLQEELKFARNEVTRLQSRLTDMEATTARVQSELAQAREKLSAQQQKFFEELKAAHVEKSEAVKEATERATSAAAAATTSSRDAAIAAARAEATALREDRDRIQRELDQAQRELRESRDMASSIAKETASLQQRLGGRVSDLTAQLTLLQSQTERAESALADARASLQRRDVEVTRLTEKLQVAMREYYVANSQFNDRIAKLSAEKARVDAELAESEKHRAELNAALDGAFGLDQALPPIPRHRAAALLSELNSTRSERDALNERVALLDAACKSAQSRADAAEKLLRTSGQPNTSAALATALAERTARIAELEETVAKLSRKLCLAEKRVADAEHRANVLAEELQGALEKIKAVTAIKERLRKQNNV